MATYRRVLSTYIGITWILFSVVVHSAVLDNAKNVINNANPGNNVNDGLNANANAGPPVYEKNQLPAAAAALLESQNKQLQGNRVVADNRNEINAQNLLNRNNLGADASRFADVNAKQQPIVHQPAKSPGIVGAMKAVKIAEYPACVNDVKKYCKGSSTSNNFGVLDCLQNDIEDTDVISDECQHFVWTYKQNLTKDIRFDSTAHDVCTHDLLILKDCGAMPRGEGQVIPCLIEKKENVTEKKCQDFLKKMQSIIFSDYRLVSMFTDSCQIDIQTLKCGRLTTDEDGRPHSQGHTVECLSKSVQSLAPDCKTQILRIAELQADDYHLNRPLYYACRMDREKFCAKTRAGGGKVYKCLFNHKFENAMSEACRSQLVLRQQIIHEDVRANKMLFDSCRKDIKKHHCLRKVDLPDGRTFRLSTVLLCLEGVQRDTDHLIAPDCIQELKEARRSLMEDYLISPEVVSHCAHEIKDYCKGGLEREGRTMHCLLSLARPQAHDNHNVRLGSNCMRELEMVLKEVDVAENVLLDPYLVEACQDVMDTVCKNHKTGDSVMMNCLMENAASDDMPDECEERLMEVQYFVSRDFELSNTHLYKFCKKDAALYCSAPEKWNDVETTNVNNAPLVFRCLYSHVHDNNKEALSRACAFEVLRVMRQRAVSVDLIPRVEQPCLIDLGRFCSQDTKKGEEMQCLQDNFDELDDKCQEAVEAFTEDEDRFIDLDRILMKACTPMIKNFCSGLIEDERSPPEDVMECLIKHKSHPNMDLKCAAGIEHHQLTNLKDYRFSYKFKESCKKDVMDVCRNEKITKKADVIKCLSEVVRNDTLLGNTHRISMKCREQLRFELLQRGENIQLDPELHEACEQNVQSFCMNVSPGRANIIECLKKHQQKLDNRCRSLLFEREKVEAVDARVDYLLVSTCKDMIKTYCSDTQAGELFECLRKHKEEEDFAAQCKRVIYERLRLRSTDVRLNPNLQRQCQREIRKFCRAELEEYADKSHMLEGRIIMCLRQQFVKKKLDTACAEHIRVRIQESARDFKQDVRLVAKCNEQVQQFCSESLAASEKDPDGGHVEECLLKAASKGKVQSKDCLMEIARIAKENRADVHIDPLLYRACALDIKTYCRDIPRGEGRQMSCLLSAKDETTVQLKPECHKMLTDRVHLWEYAAKAAPAESVGELANEIMSSPSRHYFLIIIFVFIGVLFITGLFCGRITKRVPAQMKNK